MTLLVGALNGESHLCKFGGHRHCGYGDMFLDLSGPHDQRVELYYRYEFLKVNHHPVKFDGHRHWWWICFYLSHNLIRPCNQGV